MSTPRPARILLVDDDRAFRISTAELLRQDGHEVATAADGPEAGERLAEGRVDLLLLDVRMPRIGGLGVLEALRLRGERVPVLMISGFGTIQTAVEAYELLNGALPASQQELVDAQLIREASALFEISPEGAVVASPGSPCS